MSERRQRAEGRRQKDQLQGDSNPPRHLLHLGKAQDRNGSAIEDRQHARGISSGNPSISAHQIEDFDGGIKLRNAAGSGQLECIQAVRPPNKFEEKKDNQPSAFCPTTSAFQGGSLGNYLAKTTLAIHTPSRALDLRVAELVTVFLLNDRQKDKLTVICDRFNETAALVKIILPLVVAIREKQLELADLKDFHLSDRIYSAIAEMSYFPESIEELSTEKLSGIINELFFANLNVR